MDTAVQEQIVAELVKLGWQVADPRYSHVVIANRPVQTFRGEDFADLFPVTFDGSVYYVKASFISRGENALSLCNMYLKGDDIAQEVAKFNDDVSKHLAMAYSVKHAYLYQGPKVSCLNDTGAQCPTCGGI